MSIVEHALLRVPAEKAKSFEAALKSARAIIEDADGFQAMSVRPAAEEDGLYLLLVVWRDIEAHRDGFRSSVRYERWRELLHGFYDALPDVSYFGDPL